MRVIVLGSGVIGVTSAWYLAQTGHEVIVLDRQSAPAMETSAANAGQVSVGYSAPWAAPGIPLKAIKWMFQRHAPLAIHLDGSLFQLRWMWQMLKNCDSQHYKINKSRMVRLAAYSLDCLKTLREQTGICYEARQRGTLQLFRTRPQYENATRDINVLEEMGLPYRLLEGSELISVEPALAQAQAQHKLVGGLQFLQDETGDCQLFTQQLAEMVKNMGVTFCYNTPVDALLYEGNQVIGVQCGHKVREAEAYVVALGCYSTPLLRNKITLPVYPLKGYSLTIPITEPARAPLSTVLDESYKIAITRFEQRIRVGGMAEIVGFNTDLLAVRRKTLEMVVQDLYPGTGNMAQATFWTGLRPMTPDGTPLVGRTRYDNLYLNTGHGSLGWTMACGSGQLIADLISGNSPAIPYEDLALSRYCD